MEGNKKLFKSPFSVILFRTINFESISTLLPICIGHFWLILIVESANFSFLFVSHLNREFIDTKMSRYQIHLVTFYLLNRHYMKALITWNQIERLQLGIKTTTKKLSRNIFVFFFIVNSKYFSSRTEELHVLSAFDSVCIRSGFFSLGNFWQFSCSCLTGLRYVRDVYDVCESFTFNFMRVEMCDAFRLHKTLPGSVNIYFFLF